MTNLVISDIGHDQELDEAATRELRGGVNYGFLSGLFAGTDSMFPTPSIVQNFMIDYDETNIQIAPVNFTNIAQDGSVANVDNVTFTSVIGQADIALLKGALGGAS